MHAWAPGAEGQPGPGRAPTPRRFLSCQASRPPKTWLSTSQTHETKVYFVCSGRKHLGRNLRGVSLDPGRAALKGP